VIIPLLVLGALEFGRRFRPLSYRLQKQVGVLTTTVEQNLRGAQVVKAYNQEQAETERFDRVNEQWFDLSAYASRLQAVNLPLLFLVANLGMVLIVWAGGLSVIHGSLTLGEMVAFTAYLGQLVDPIRRLGMIIPAVIMASSAAERIFDVLDSVSDVNDAPEAAAMPPMRGQVRFEGISFRYGKRQVLSGIDFQAEPGQVIALVGPTGSGKTSIINLIPRFYDPTLGRVLIDGIDIRQVTLYSLRSQVGIVLQESVLFSGSVRENLMFGCNTCDEADMVAAARAAQADEFIRAMPQGYDTRVGERGVTLSGGQKQRLAIARAILMDPRILILDDATASVDVETEYHIQHALARLMEGRTTFVIAHRLSTVMRADQILVLEQGHIAARGTHASLIHASPLYAEIYQHQLVREADLQQVDLQQAGLQQVSLPPGEEEPR
jgi:ATP-binding cassette subfamily B protein